MADATPDEVLEYVKSASYPNSKANYLVGTARKLIALFNGQVPNNVDQLQQLPGVGRKTANVIAAVVYGQPTMAVDTHVFRVANRVGLTDNSKSPLQTEQTLTQYIPQQVIADAHHWLILHGRYVCTARNPKCTTCGIKHWCQEYENSQG
jgi:endonuclease-3